MVNENDETIGKSKRVFSSEKAEEAEGNKDHAGWIMLFPCLRTRLIIVNDEIHLRIFPRMNNDLLFPSLVVERI